MSLNTYNNYAKVFGINWVNSAVNISLKNKYVYVEVPKAASSTIKIRLHEIELIELDGYKAGAHPDIVHSPFVKPYQLSIEQLKSALFSDEYFRFTFVRNPYDRILSAYLDKIARKAPEKSQIDKWSVQVIGSEKEEYSFSEFIKIVATQKDHHRDKHWRTQSNLTMINTINYDIIGKIEELKAGTRKIQNLSRVELTQNLKRYSPHKTDAHLKRKEYFDDENSEIVREIYKDDFANFNYNKSWMS